MEPSLCKEQILISIYEWTVKTKFEILYGKRNHNKWLFWIKILLIKYIHNLLSCVYVGKVIPKIRIGIKTILEMVSIIKKSGKVATFDKNVCTIKLKFMKSDQGLGN